LNTFISVLVALLVIGVVYFWIIRPRILNWGATRDEAYSELVGDDLVKQPHFIATRAITIKAPPSEIWKWIVQIGSGRAGWYSLDWIDNANKPSTMKILPEFQKIEDGYFIPFTPDQKNGMWVKNFKENEHILWWDQKGNATWGWYLHSNNKDRTRLITRLRTRYDFSFPWVIYYLIYDFGDFIMMRKCMRGIKERAEING
jgi:hypothetical protein